LNKQQIIDVLKGLLVAGGPIVAILINIMGMERGPAEKIVEGIAALVSVAGIVWLAIGRTDRNMVADASTVKGVQVHVDPATAPSGANAAVKDASYPDVVPMTGGPVEPTKKEMT
jgi:hypothetical protein